MKMNKALAIGAAVTVVATTVIIASTGVFADQTGAWSSKTFAAHFTKAIVKGDPVERLNKAKENLQERVQDGKLTQEEADKKIAEIDKKIKEIQDFNSLTVEQKREKLLKDFTESINQKVKDGKLTQENADKMLSNFKAKVDAWDGSGNPPYFGKGLMGKDFRGEGRSGRKSGTEMKGNMDPALMLEKRKEMLQEKVKEGKLTQEEADKRLAEIEKRVKEMQEFNSMTVEQKKEKLLKDFTASTEERVKAGKLTKEEADKLTAEFKAKLEAWDGTGRIPFAGMGHKGGRGFKDGFKGIKE